MTAITLVPKKPSISSRVPIFFDKALENASIVIDNAAYLATKDRLYDVHGMGKGWAQFKNVGANSIDMLIEKTHKEFTDITTLTEVDFEDEVIEDAIAAGVAATGTVDVTGGPSVKAEGDLTLVSAVANAFATGTAQCTSVIATDTITVNGILYTGVAGVKANNEQFSIDTSNTACAADLADSITNDTRTGTLGDQTATSSGDTVTITTDVLGTTGDAITLAQTGGTITLSGATFSGGVTADQVIVNGLVYLGVAGAKADNTQFSIDTSDTAAATDLADSITNDTRTPITVPTIDVIATNSLGVVTVEAPINDGAAGNAIDTIGSANITAAGATLASGVSSSMDGITVDDIEIMSGPVPFDTDDDTTATNVAANITANTSIPNYTAVAVGSLITITKVEQEASTFVVVSSTTVLTTTDVNFSGGANGKSVAFSNTAISPEITALKFRFKETAGGSPGAVKSEMGFIR
ncbi:hypothetical protein LCGC14_0380450 [marine sediment metagenome]|uniref:Uncharacterized protein n=1 Tax=marine sediment metagenome TaxID=412755 RepID=A0A0F9T8C6_9ZZZZ